MNTHTDVKRKTGHLEPSQATTSNSQATPNRSGSGSGSGSRWVVGVRRHGQNPLKCKYEYVPGVPGICHDTIPGTRNLGMVVQL